MPHVGTERELRLSVLFASAFIQLPDTSLLFCVICYVIWFHSAVITALVHGTNLGELGLKMRQIKGSRSGQSYSEHQTIYTLSKVYNHKDKPPSGKTTFFRDMNNSS